MNIIVKRLKEPKEAKFDNLRLLSATTTTTTAATVTTSARKYCFDK